MLAQILNRSTQVKPSTFLYSLSLVLYTGLIWLMFCGFFIETVWWYL